MKTKSYLIEEHKEKIFDNAEIEEWKSIVDQLGAEGQAKLISGENKSMLPFPIMKEAEATIYSDVLNRKEDYKQFSAEAIPLEGLSLIALAEKEEYFEKIEIWYSTENPDPLIIGKKYTTESDKEKGYDWNMAKYLIFQWGEKIKTLEQLLPFWEKYHRDKAKMEYEEKIQTLERSLNKFKFQVLSMQ